MLKGRNPEACLCLYAQNANIGKIHTIFYGYENTDT